MRSDKRGDRVSSDGFDSPWSPSESGGGFSSWPDGWYEGDGAFQDGEDGHGRLCGRADGDGP